MGIETALTGTAIGTASALTVIEIGMLTGSAPTVTAIATGIGTAPIGAGMVIAIMIVPVATAMATATATARTMNVIGTATAVTGAAAIEALVEQAAREAADLKTGARPARPAAEILQLRAALQEARAGVRALAAGRGLSAGGLVLRSRHGPQA